MFLKADTLLMTEHTTPNNPFSGRSIQVFIEESRYGPYEVVKTRTGHGVSVIAVSGRDVLLVGQDRPAVKHFLWDFPGGGADNGDVALKEEAARELVEETNIVVSPEDLIPVDSYFAMAGMFDTQGHKFFVRLPDDFDRSIVKHQESELQGIGWFNIDTLFEKFKDRDVQFSGVVGELLKAQLLGLI